MALPVILVTSLGGGSDTAASGAGPSTALFGTAAALASSTTVTVSIDAPDLSGVATDGSACMWVDSSSGRQFSRITAVDNVLKTVTVATAYGVTEGTRNWGIGGKRATLNNADTRTLGADAEPGWIIEIAAGDTQTLTTAWAISAAGDTTSGKIIIRGASGTRPIITCATNSIVIFSITAVRWRFTHLNLTHTAGTRGIGINYASVGADQVEVDDCVIDGCSVGVSMASAVDSPVIRNNEIKNCTSNGITLRSAAVAPVGEVTGNYIHDNGGDGIGGTVVWTANIERNVIVKNTGKGISCTATTGNLNQTLDGNTISDNGSHGIYSALTTGNNNFGLQNNLIYGNTGWGILCDDTQLETDTRAQFNCNNAFGGNSSGAQSGIAAGSGDVALSANPFTNDSGASRDFSLNNTAGGGAACRAAGFPGAFVGASFVGYPDVGAVQSQAAAGGGGWPSIGPGLIH